MFKFAAHNHRVSETVSSFRTDSKRKGLNFNTTNNTDIMQSAVDRRQDS
jgi:hypothetical protein